MTTWGIRVREETYRLDDLTVFGAAQVCETAKCGLGDLNPVNQPAHLGALVAAFTVSDEVSFDQALLAVAQRNLAEVHGEHLVVVEEG